MTTKTERKPDGSRPEDDRLMMENPDWWSNWPYQTIKNRNIPDKQFKNMPATALLVEVGGPTEDGVKPNLRFVDANLFLVQPEDVQQAKAADIDALIKAGWVID